MEKTILDNGGVIISEYNDSKSCGIVLGVRFGSLYEKDEDAGIAHFFEHLFMRATKNRPSKEFINGTITQKGGQIQGTTSTHWTKIQCKVLAKDFDFALELMFDCFNNMLIDEKAIKEEQGIVNSEIHSKQDNQLQYQYLLFNKTLHKNNPAGRAILGYSETITNFTVEKLNNIHKKYYSSNNMILSYVGSMNHQELVQKAIKLFPNHISKLKTLELKDNKINGRTYVEDIRSHLKQASLSLGFFAPKINERDYYSFKVLSTILGSGTNSRLFKEIRTKRNLSYDIHAEYFYNIFFGDFKIYSLCPRDKLKEMEELILNEFNLIRQNLKEEEITWAKEQIINTFILKNEDTLTNANNLFSFEINNIDLSKFTEDISKVTLEEVKNVADKYLDTKNYVVVILKS